MRVEEGVGGVPAVAGGDVCGHFLYSCTQPGHDQAWHWACVHSKGELLCALKELLQLTHPSHSRLRGMV